MIDNSIPGPGAYDPKLAPNNLSIAFTNKSKREELVQIQDTPGPGRYEINKPLNKSPRWSIQGNKEKNFDNSLPGPGTYEIDTVKPMGYSTPKSQRPELFQSATEFVPGPGEYSTNDPSPKKVNFFIGKSKRPDIVSSTPGPGKYESSIQSNAVNIKFGTEVKRTLEFKNDNQCCNIYSPKINKKSPSYSFGVKTAKKDGNGVPGPGSYTGEKPQFTKNIKLGKSQRFAQSYIEKESLEKPGPGNYNVPSTFQGKLFISKAKREFHHSNSTPGPGQYNPIKI